MEIGAIIVICAICFLVFMFCKTPDATKELHSNKKNKQHKTLVHGVDINMSKEDIEEINNQKEKNDFQNAVKSLKEIILDDMKNTSDMIRKEVLNNLHERVINNKDDLQELDFLYNDGQLRTNEEVEYFKKWKSTKKQRDNYDTECHKRNVLCFTLPFIITFLVVCAKFGDFILGAPIALILGFVAAMIGSIIGNSINISKAKEYCIGNDDPCVQAEKLKRNIGITSTIIAGHSIGKHAKQATKDLLNVDSWKEMK